MDSSISPPPPPPPRPRPRQSHRTGVAAPTDVDDGPEAYGGTPGTLQDYEVTFMQSRLGLTIKCQPPDELENADEASRMVVKSACETARQVHEGDILLSVNGQSVVHLDFRDVRRLLKSSSRPIQLRFRKPTPSELLQQQQAQLGNELEQEQDSSSSSDNGDEVDENQRFERGDSEVANASRSSSMSSCSSVAVTSSRTSISHGRRMAYGARRPSGDMITGGVSAAPVSFTVPRRSILLEAEIGPAGRDEREDDDDMDSQYAVQSESFGDADSTRTTENSSVMTELTESEFKMSRHSSLFTAFLRKPFRRVDGFDHRVFELRVGTTPHTPRVELAFESPSKAALRVYWEEHPSAIASQVQFARDRAVRVWKTWTGRTRRSSENDREMTTLIFGLDLGKSYVVRIRFEFDRLPFTTGEWSCPSVPVVTVDMARLEALRAASLRSSRD